MSKHRFNKCHILQTNRSSINNNRSRWDNLSLNSKDAKKLLVKENRADAWQQWNCERSRTVARNRAALESEFRSNSLRIQFIFMFEREAVQCNISNGRSLRRQHVVKTPLFCLYLRHGEQQVRERRLLVGLCFFFMAKK